MDLDEMIKHLRETPSQVAQEIATRETDLEVVVEGLVGIRDYDLPDLRDPNPDKMDFSERVYEAGIGGRLIRSSTSDPALRDAAENLRQVAYKELRAVQHRHSKLLGVDPDWEQTIDYAKVAEAAQKVLDLGAPYLTENNETNPVGNNSTI